MANLSFFTSKGGELLYNFFYLASCAVVIFMLFSEWQRTGTKNSAYLLYAFVVMLINLVFINLSLANEIFFNAPHSYFLYPIITWNLRALSIIFVTGAFIYPVAQKTMWLKKYISYNITFQVLSFCIITPLWLNHYYVLRDYNKFWGAYYYNVWIFLVLAITVIYLHFNAADYYQETLLRLFLGILLFDQGLRLYKLVFPDSFFMGHITVLERILPLAASFTLLFTIYKNIVSSLVKANTKLDQIRRQLDQSNQELEKKVLIRTREISETNKELMRFKDFHKNIIESLTDGILVVDRGGSLLAINRAAQQHLQVPPPAPELTCLQDLLPPPSRMTWEELIEKVVTTGREKRLIKRHFKLPQLEEELIVNLLAQPLKDKELHKIGMILTIEFITEKVELEKKIKRSEKLAYMGKIAAGVAHEIRNPLNSISINLQLFRRNITKSKLLDKEPLLERLKIIDGEISRLDEIVQEFVQFARPKKIKPQPQDINRLLEEISFLIGEQASLAGVTLVKELDEKLPRSLIDEGQIKQVFLNISINSMQAMAPAGGTLTLKSRSYSPRGGEEGVQVIFRDTGKGMNEQEQKKIFEPFYSSKEDGLGLGLAVAQQIIEDHGGDISLKSQSGEGTEFTITLPVAPNGV